MKIYLATDHAGLELKESVKKYLIDQSFEVEDCGAYSLDPNDDYPDIISRAAEKVSQNSEKDFSIVKVNSQVIFRPLVEKNSVN